MHMALLLPKVVFWYNKNKERRETSIPDIEVLEGSMPSKQLKMLLGWAAFHQDELMENWELAQKKQELFEIEPLK